MSPMLRMMTALLFAVAAGIGIGTWIIAADAGMFWGMVAGIAVTAIGTASAVYNLRELL